MQQFMAQFWNALIENVNHTYETRVLQKYLPVLGPSFRTVRRMAFFPQLQTTS